MFTHRHTVEDRDLEESTSQQETEGRHTADEAAAATDTTYDEAHDRYGGMNAGADFFGWLVAVATAVLTMGILGALGAAVNTQVEISQDTAEREAGTIGIVAAAVLVLVAGLSYYAGGYVAGRMSRFDGGRQGLGVWLIGLVVMVLGAIVGTVFGAQYNVLDRIDLPQLPLSGFEASIGAVITGAALLVVTLLAALAGGKVGRNYHRKVDAARVAANG